jgi:hypothetical protein
MVITLEEEVDSWCEVFCFENFFVWVLLRCHQRHVVIVGV